MSEPFTVDTEARAAWATDKVLSARERAARIKAQCEALIAEAEREAEDTAAYFLPILEDWARANPPRRGKTIKLPTGSLAFRTVPGGPRVTDQAACLAWAREHLPAAVVVSERLSATAVKDYTSTTGELPPGVEVVETRESFDVRAQS